MKKRILTILTAAIVAVTSLVPAEAVFAGDMYRMYNWNSGEHFYTASVNERNHLASLGWNYEGIGWTAPDTGTPVYRLYNPNAGDHHYTTNVAERNNLVRLGWNYEGIGWRSGGSVPLYREYNPNAKTGTHNYTTSKGENDSLVRLGWRYEGIAWYGENASKGSFAYPDGRYYAYVYTPYYEGNYNYVIYDASLDNNVLTISGRLAQMDSEGNTIRRISGDNLQFPIRDDTLFVYVAGEDDLELMSAEEYADKITMGEIGPATTLLVQNGYVVSAYTGA